MGHKSWGGARPNKHDREFHEEPGGPRYYIEVRLHEQRYVVIDSDDYSVVFGDEDKLTCECECDLLNSMEQA